MATLRTARVLALVSSSAARTFSCRRGLSLLRSPMARIWMPSACISPTSESMVSPNSCISAATSWRGRDQFSVLKAYSVRMCDAGGVARLHHRADRGHAGAMTGGARQVTAARPATVAVHDDADVARQLRAGRLRDRGWRWRSLHVCVLNASLQGAVSARERARGQTSRISASFFWARSSTLPMKPSVMCCTVAMLRSISSLDDVALLLEPAQVVHLVAADVAHRDARLLGLAA